MKKLLPLSVFPVLCLMAAAPSYQNSVDHWRQDQEAALKADDGWLTVVGLFWLKEGANTVGSDPASDIPLPRGPARAGVFEFHGGNATFQPASDAGALVNGQPATAAAQLKADTEGKADIVEIGDLDMFVIHRGNRYGIRLRDKQSKLRKDFTALHWYPVKDEYRVTADFVAYDAPRMIPVPNILGETSLEASPGFVVFSLHGQLYRLEPVVEDKELFFIFRDLTAGKETYPSGRFLHSELPKDGKVVLDFNKAYNPPCAFTLYATCPLPPRQNRLQIHIEAGELNYGHHE